MQHDRERQHHRAAGAHAAPHQHRQRQLHDERRAALEQQQQDRLGRQRREHHVQPHDGIARQVRELRFELSAARQPREIRPLAPHEHADEPRFGAGMAEPVADAASVAGRRPIAAAQEAHPDVAADLLEHGARERTVRDERKRLREPAAVGRAAQHEAMEGAFDDHREQREDGDADDRVAAVERKRLAQHTKQHERQQRDDQRGGDQHRQRDGGDSHVFPCSERRTRCAACPNDTQLAVDARTTSSPRSSATRASPPAPSMRSCTNSTAL